MVPLTALGALLARPDSDNSGGHVEKFLLQLMITPASTITEGCCDAHSTTSQL